MAGDILLNTLSPPPKVWHHPKMPVLTEEDRTRFDFIEPQNLGSCWGSDLQASRYPVRTENGPSNIYILKWRGYEVITVEADYYTHFINGIWLDVDNDGNGDEFYRNTDHVDQFYGNGQWYCHLIKRVLDYWR